MDHTKIGWIGLGKMGVPMAKQLIKAGFEVTGYNRSGTKESALTIAGSPAGVLEIADIVVVMVTDDHATREVFGALLKGSGKARLLINMSTVSPGVSREVAGLCEAQGHAYLDAPVSGSVKQAEEGQLVVMVGGTEMAFERGRPVLEHLGKLVFRVGDIGMGNMAKLAINALLACHAQALAETVRFAEGHGVKTDDFLAIVNNSALSNVFARIKGEAILKGNYQAAFALKHIAKDLRLAKAEGLVSPLVTTAFNTFQAAEPALGEEDIIAVIKALG